MLGGNEFRLRRGFAEQNARARLMARLAAGSREVTGEVWQMIIPPALPEQCAARPAASG